MSKEKVKLPFWAIVDGSKWRVEGVTALECRHYVKRLIGVVADIQPVISADLDEWKDAPSVDSAPAGKLFVVTVTRVQVGWSVHVPVWAPDVATADRLIREFAELNSYGSCVFAIVPSPIVSRESLDSLIAYHKSLEHAPE